MVLGNKEKEKISLCLDLKSNFLELGHELHLHVEIKNQIKFKSFAEVVEKENKFN